MKYVDPDPKLAWPISYAAVCEIAKSEGLRLVAYRCSAGIPTIARGRTKGVKMGDKCTLEQADRWFLEELDQFTADVRALLKRDPSANELGAMVSLAYNIGVAGFKNSTVLRKFNEGDLLAASRAFALWNKITVNGTKVVSNGLTARRAREAAFFLTPDDGAEDGPMPQAVEAESSINQSPIAQSGAATVLAGAAALLSSIVDPIKDFADKMGIQPVTVLAGVAIVAGIVIVLNRKKQRDQGWA